MQIHISEFRPEIQAHELTIWERVTIDGKPCINIVTDVTFQHIEEGLVFPDIWRPRLEKADVQALMDEMWQRGIRPTDFAHEGMLKESHSHIDTLRSHTERLSVWIDRLIKK